MSVRISREDALNTFLGIVSKIDGFENELNKHRVVLSYNMYLTENLVKEMKKRIKTHHMKHNQHFVIVDNLENMVKFIRSASIPAYSILISENSAIAKTSLGKFDEKKLLDILLVKVADVYKFEKCYTNNNFNLIGLYVFDSIVSELNLNNSDIITASKTVLNEIIKLATQIKNKYGQQVCNHQNCWRVSENDIVWEINEKFVANNHTETIDKYNLYVRYFDILTYMIEVIEYKLKGEVEDPESIPEEYYKNISQYCNGFIYSPSEIDNFKIVRSKISIGGNSRIKNLKDYITTLKCEGLEKLLNQVDKLAELSEGIQTEFPESVDNQKLITPTVNFIDKSFAESHIDNQNVLDYQNELNVLLDMVGQIN